MIFINNILESRRSKMSRDVTFRQSDTKLEHVNRDGVLEVIGNCNQIQVRDCNCQTTIRGNGNRIRIEGSIVRINVIGNGNELEVSTSDIYIQVNGNSNELIKTDSKVTLIKNEGFSNDIASTNKIEPGQEQGRDHEETQKEHAKKQLASKYQEKDSGRRAYSGSMDNEDQNLLGSNIPQYQQNFRMSSLQGPSPLSGSMRQGYGYPQYSPMNSATARSGDYYLNNNSNSNSNGTTYTVIRPGREPPTNSPQLSRIPLSGGIRLDGGPPLPSSSSHDNQKISSCSFNQQEFQLLPKKKKQPKQDHQAQQSVEQCAICQSEIIVNEEITVLFCLHSFHTECLKAWLMKSRKCPLCQFDVKKYFEEQVKESVNGKK